jgi:hypothetical protein
MLLRRSGNATHDGHPSQIPEELLNRKRNVGEEDLGNIRAIAVANITPAQTALVQKAKTEEGSALPAVRLPTCKVAQGWRKL